MVTNRLSPDGRGQLMLVGAVSLALILMGLVVVFNTVLYTDAKSGADSLEDAAQAEALTSQIQKETKLLALYMYNDSGRSGSLAGFGNNITAWSNVQGLSHAQTGPTFVKIECVSGCSSPSMGNQVTLRVIWETQNVRYSNTVQIQLPDSSATDAPALDPVVRP